MKDVIQREITIKASKQRVYDAIANPEKVTKWFPQTLDGEYKVGAQPVFGFGEHGKNRISVVAAQPHEYFAYRWVPGANHYLGDMSAVATTLVEFRIAEQADGTCKVTLTESGFSSLPAETMEPAFKQNSGGWDFMLGRLEKYFEATSSD
ncbi:MAG: SRPBCC family protein [Polyangiaceae bacterium]